MPKGQRKRRRKKKDALVTIGTRVSKGFVRRLEDHAASKGVTPGERLREFLYDNEELLFAEATETAVPR